MLSASVGTALLLGFPVTFTTPVNAAVIVMTDPAPYFPFAVEEVTLVTVGTASKFQVGLAALLPKRFLAMTLQVCVPAARFPGSV